MGAPRKANSIAKAKALPPPERTAEQQRRAVKIDAWIDEALRREREGRSSKVVKG